MKQILLTMIFTAATSIAFAADNFKMNFRNEEITNIIQHYSKETGQKFIVDPGVRGKISILLPDVVSKVEAFEHLSSALAINGFAISKQGETMVVTSARNIQRSAIEVSTQIPEAKPIRMYAWIYTAHNIQQNKSIETCEFFHQKMES